MNDTTTTMTCDTCNEEISVPSRFANQPQECESCMEIDKYDTIRESLDPTKDTLFSRPEALDRLDWEMDALPAEDYDGTIITEVNVKRGRGIGAEPNGYWVESISKLVECEECGNSTARYHYKSNAGHNPVNATECSRCGFEEYNV